MVTRDIFTFPHPVNEVSARIVAAGVALMAVLTLALRRPWLLIPIAYGFIARVLTGPKLSPLGQLSTRVITPRVPTEPRYVPGPPKRFAQGIGAVLSVAALVSAFGFRRPTVSFVLIGILGVFATLEAVFAFCAGCKIFAGLMRLGLVPEEVCAECANLWEHPNLRASAPPPPGPSDET
jgi:hypothetical protein